MIRTLKLAANKVLKETTLTNLDRITVICGKNNSGKSTLLEAIASDARLIGRSLNEEVLDRVFYGHLAYLTRSHRSTNWETIEARIRRALLESAKLEEVWFADQRDLFATHAQKIINLPDAQTNIDRGWNAFFGIGVGTILLPPKRQLDLIHSVDNQQKVSPSGIGILNALFHAKNQDASSDNNQNYRLLSEAFTEISSGYTFSMF